MIFLLFHKRKKKLASRAPSEHNEVVRCAPSAKRKKIICGTLAGPYYSLIFLKFLVFLFL